MSKTYNYCFVPGCRNNSISAPGKVFISVPSGPLRDKWLDAARVKKKYSSKSTLKCCEDHFEVEKDIEGWLQFRLMKDLGRSSFKLKVKAGVVPHIFNSQQEANVLKRAAEDPPEATPSKKSHGASGSREPHFIDVLPFAEDDSEQGSSGAQKDEPSTKDFGVQVEKLTEDFGVQVNIKPKLEIRHVESMNFGFRLPQIPEELKPVSCASSSSSSSSKGKQRQRKKKIDPIYSYSQNSSQSSSLTVKNSQGNQASQESVSEYEKAHEMQQSQDLNMKLMYRKSRLYLGIPKGARDLIPLLEKFTGLSKVKIFMALRRVRLHESTEILGDVFGFHKSTVCKYLNESLPLLAAYLKSFIFWPNDKIIQTNVPIAFRANYSKVTVIIDCFEVGIEQPSNPLHQALTWSDYKGCNTLKFLVGCTPAGHICFISEGYGGRMTDMALINDSGFLDFLSPGNIVMTDRGFKSIDSVLAARGCYLVRPPSVRKNQVMTKDEVRQTKIIASLRIHVERLIRRIREFSFMARHAHFHHEAVGCVDATAVIACALCNLQPVIAV